MAIREENVTQQNTAQGTVPPVYPQPDVNANNLFAKYRGGLFGAPISANTGSEITNKLTTKLKEIFEAKSPENVTLKAIAIDNNVEARLTYSIVLVCQQNKGSKKVAFHTLILEATGTRRTPIFENINGRSVEILKLPSEAFDDIMSDIVISELTQQYPGSEFLNSDACLIPQTFVKWDDVTSMLNIAANAAAATGNALLLASPSYKDIDIVGISDPLAITIDFTPQSSHQDITYEPVRSDFEIRFESRPNQNSQVNKYAINSTASNLTISRVTGYMDFVWAPVAGMQGIYAQANPYAPQQKFAARMVLTDVESVFSYSPAAMMLYLASAMTMGENNNWMLGFRPGIDKDTMTDISALNIEGNLGNSPNGIGEKPNMMLDTFSIEEYYAFVTRLVRPGMMMAIDVPEAGPQSWFTSLFSEGARGNSNAKNLIIKACNDLTRNMFSNYWNPGSEIFATANERIHLGHFTDARSIVRDLRYIDYLAVANMVGEKNPKQLRDWADTYTQTQYPEVQRLSERRRMISGFCHESAVYTGFAQRVTFSSAFMTALSQAIKACNVYVNVTTPAAVGNIPTERGFAGYADTALVNGAVPFHQRPFYQGGNPGMNWGGHRY